MKNRGITLITLIITIIVLLILAGVAISAFIMDGGIINNAENAAQKYNESAEKESNVINELWEQAAIDTSNKIEKIEVNITLDNNNQITINTTVKGEATKYVYVINNERIETTESSYIKSDCVLGTDYVIYVIAYDSEGGVKYSERQIANTANIPNKIESVVVTANANSSSQITINTTVKGEASKYIYVINDERVETTKTSYTKSNCMYGTEYEVYVIGYDSNGKEKVSNKVTVKTKDRTYLYKAGDECTAITGGWIRGNYNCGSLTKNSTYMNLQGVRTGGPDKKWNVVNTKNLINFSEYKTIYWELEVDQCKNIGGYYYTWFNTVISSNPKTANYDTLNIASAYLRLNGLTSPIAINKRLTFSKAIDANTSGYAAAAWGNWTTASNPTGNLKIYNVWLEK